MDNFQVGLNIGQVAELFNVSITSLRRYERQGFIPAPSKKNGWRRYRKDDIEAITRYLEIKRTKKTG
jgi:DNA-binding transcriptional MerR regulator